MATPTYEEGERKGLTRWTRIDDDAHGSQAALACGPTEDNVIRLVTADCDTKEILEGIRFKNAGEANLHRPLPREKR